MRIGMNRKASLFFLPSLLSIGVAVGCSSGSPNDTTPPDFTGRDPETGFFESDDPKARGDENDSKSSGGSSSGGSSDAGAAAPNASEGSDSSDAARAVQEADILKLDGNKLFALSRYGGLSIIDVSQKDKLTLLGRYRMEAMPFEMYVKDGVAYVMMNEWGRWVGDESGYAGQWVQSSEMLALDVSNPSQIKKLASYDVPGTISDSRMVGDVVYLVTFENGYCYGCQQTQATVVTSFGTVAGFNKVAQLSYAAPSQGYSWAKRSVSATNQRLYIAGPTWNWNGQGQQNSVIQVVDITNPAGLLVKGADVPVEGQITSRWQMDEYQGVLRVVSQYGNTWQNGTKNPKVQTFQVQNASTVVPLGHTDLILPKPESLRSVRFDGVRGYAITAERTDPLYTIDLADVAHPKQAGELEMPGWIYHMEPMGDRLVGFGYDDTVGSAGLQVSLFDVSTLAKPTMLKRVHFGQGWGSFAEDQDRMHKALQILPDQNLILVPFASYGNWSNGNCSKGQSGIQLIDMTHDDLTLRGVAPQHGQPRRALTTDGRLLGISDRNVSLYDYANRDAPKKTAELDLSNPAYKVVSMGNNVLQLTNDWWTQEPMLTVMPKDNIDNASPIGRISLAQLAPPNPSYCGSSGVYAWTAWYAARMFVNGSMAYITVPMYSYNYNGGGSSTNERKMLMAALDLSNPAAPTFVGQKEITFPAQQNYGYYYWGGGFLDGYAFYSYAGGYYGALAGTGSAVVQQGSKLAFMDTRVTPSSIPNNGSSSGSGPYVYTPPTFERDLYVVDFANPAQPVAHPPVAMGESLGVTPLHLQDGKVLSSRWNPSPVPGKVRFYVDRVDIAGATPSSVTSLNVPGSLIAADGPSGRLVTMAYEKTVKPATDYTQCYGKNYYSYNNRWYDSTKHLCYTVERNLRLLDVIGPWAVQRQRVDLPSQNLGGIVTSDDRIYVTRYSVYDYSKGQNGNGVYVAPTVIEQGGLSVFGGIRQGQLNIVSQFNGGAKWPLAVAGTKIALWQDQGVSFYDTATATPRKMGDAQLRGWGYTSDIIIENDRAICAVGEWGAQTVALQ